MSGRGNQLSAARCFPDRVTSNIISIQMESQTMYHEEKMAGQYFNACSVNAALPTLSWSNKKKIYVPSTEFRALNLITEQNV